MAGTRGGRRPGAGRKKKIFTVSAESDAAVRSEAGIPLAAPGSYDPNDPAQVIEWFMRGEKTTPDGVPLTPERLIAAEKLLRYRHSPMATTTERRGPSKPIPEYTDDELRQIIADEIEARECRARTIGASAGENFVPGVLPESPEGEGRDAGGAP